MKKILITLFIVLTAAAYSFAEVDHNGKSSISYKGGFSGNPTDAEIQQAYQKAIEVAWNKYIATLDESKIDSYNKNKNSINYKDFILETSILDERTDKKMKVYEVFVRTKIDVKGFDAKMKSYSEVFKRDSDERSPILAVFVGRQVTGVTDFDTKKTKVKTVDQSADAAINTEVGETSERTSTSLSTVEKIQTGGSSEKKKAVKENKTLSITKFSGAFNKVLAQNGYEPLEYADILDCGAPNMDDIKEQFAVNDELKPELKKQLTNAAKECEISYLVIGTVDITFPHTDPATGGKEVTATVSGTATNLKGKRNPQIATLGSNAVSARGRDDDTAANAAVEKAATSAAKIIVDQLHAKGAY